MTSATRTLGLIGIALVSVVGGCKFDLDSIPSAEDCEAAGLTDCANNAGSGAVGGSGGSGAVGGSGGSGGGSGGCRITEFECDNGDCVPFSVRCDSNSDCPDDSDEDPAMCGGGCGPLQFECGGGGCILNVLTCNSSSDCADGSDEDPGLCGTTGCDPNEFTCANGGCVPISYRCDGDNDCGDNSDEATNWCGGDNACGRGSFACSNGGCIPESSRCDSNDDCGDRSDESPGWCVAGAYNQARCAGSTDCVLRGQVCGDVDFVSGAAYCIVANADGQGGGFQCSDPLGYSECNTTLCFANTMECSAPCTTSSDCDSVNGPPLCAAYLTGDGSPLGLCGTECYSPDYCRGDQTCGIAIDASTREVRGICNSVRRDGSVVLRNAGEPCSVDTECASELCVQSPLFGGAACSVVCEVPAQCQLPFQRCAPYNQLGTGLTGNIFVCQ